MPEWLDQLLGKKKTEQAADEKGHLVKESELQSLRLVLDEQEKTIQRLKAEIVRLQAAQNEDTLARLQGQLLNLFQDISQPLVQMLAQHHLGQKSVTINIENLAHLTHQIVAALEKYGFQLDGQLSEAVAYDPSLHTPLNAVQDLKPGTPVQIRIQGTRLAGETLHKAIVTPINE